MTYAKIMLFVFVFVIIQAPEVFAAKKDGGMSLFSTLGVKKRTQDSVTKISSDMMDIDISKNKAEFTGNVIVDDAQLKITCHKMIILLKDAADKDSKLAKTIDKIVCVEDVVITRKLGDKENVNGDQKAIAGRAEYEMETGKITLSDKPILMRGSDKLSGEVITIWRDSNRMTVKGRGDIEMKSRNEEF